MPSPPLSFPFSVQLLRLENACRFLVTGVNDAISCFCVRG
jgi:hypothetical protein